MKLFVWDFHGTLEKGNENAVLEMSNTVLNQHGFVEQFTEDQCRFLYGKKWYEYFEHLLPHLPNKKHIELQNDCFSFSLSHPEIIAKYIKVSNHALEVLEQIQQKHDQILVSNTKPESLIVFMDSVGISHFFPSGKAFATDAHSVSGTKKDIVMDYIEKSNFDEIITIGDSPSDIELGKAFGAKTFLYTHSGIDFKDCAADYKIRDLRDVLAVI